MISKNISLAVVCVILGVLLSWQLKSINYIEELASVEKEKANAIKEELLLEKGRNEELVKRSKELEKANHEFESTNGQINQTTKILTRDLDEIRSKAGLMDVSGDGVQVVIDEEWPNEIGEEELLGLINLLKISGAQAIAVNDERIIATSEVRKTTNKYILVNGKQLIVPYEIKAIVDADKFASMLKNADGNLKNLETSSKKDMMIAKYNGNIDKLVSGMGVQNNEAR
ncbi:MAG: DUF881 domain-containing protein [Clostridia bacterium]|nr:DUF881 domain-containing protein [Clostridia bacterium]